MPYDQGTPIQCYTVPPFTVTATGVLVDPGQVLFVCTVPAGPTIRATYTQGSGDPTSTIVRDGVGSYHAIVPGTLPGDYEYRFYSLVSGVSSARGRFSVVADPLI